MLESDLDPWPVLRGQLLELSSYLIPGIVDKTGMSVNWLLTEREDYSHKYRIAAYRPRIDDAYYSLSKDDRLRVAYILASELEERGMGDSLNAALEKIGWRVEEGHLTPSNEEVKELFFPKDTQHDAYVEIRKLFQKAQNFIEIIDPYIHSSVLTVVGTLSPQSIIVQLLTYKMSSDFIQEARKFLSQHNNFKLEIRKSKEFHDRFIIIDNIECWHIGCSIKDAGNKAFMLSKIEDNKNQDVLVKQLKSSWSKAEVINI